MLTEKRIKEAETNVKIYLEEKLLTKSQFDKKIFDILLQNAKESLETAGFLLKNKKSDLWVIVISYYAMYYVANAVLYKKGYKIGEKISHKITADALIVFIRNSLKQTLIESYEELKSQALAGIKSDELIKSFDFERKKRGFIQYQTTSIEKHAKANTSLQRAKEFIFEMEKLL